MESKKPKRRTKIGKKRKRVDSEEFDEDGPTNGLFSDQAEEMDDEEIIEEEAEADQLDVGESGDFHNGDIDKRKDDSDSDEIEEIEN